MSWRLLLDNEGSQKHWYWYPGWSFKPEVFGLFYQQLPGTHWGMDYPDADIGLPAYAQKLADIPEQTPGIHIGWSLGGAIACHVVSTCNEENSLVTLATGKTFLQQPGKTQGMSLATFQDFSGQLQAAPDKTRKRFLGLCTQSHAEPRPVMRLLAQHQITRPECLQYSLNWLNHDELPLLGRPQQLSQQRPQQHWYAAEDQLHGECIEPGRVSSSHSHAFFLMGQGQNEILQMLSTIGSSEEQWV